MTTEYFTKETDDKGNETYTQTEDVIEQSVLDEKTTEHDAVMKLLSDSDIKIENGELVLPVVEKDSKEKDVEANVDETNTAPPANPPIDIEALSTEILSKVVGHLDKVEQEKQKVTDLLSEHKLSESFRSILTESRNPVNTAKALGQAMLKLPNVDSNSVTDTPATVISSLFDQVDGNLGRAVKND